MGLKEPDRSDADAAMRAYQKQLPVWEQATDPEYVALLHCHLGTSECIPLTSRYEPVLLVTKLVSADLLNRRVSTHLRPQPSLAGQQGDSCAPACCLNQWLVMQTLRLRLGRRTSLFPWMGTLLLEELVLVGASAEQLFPQKNPGPWAPGVFVSAGPRQPASPLSWPS